MANHPNSRAHVLVFLLIVSGLPCRAQTTAPAVASHYNESAVLWQQSSGERNALSYQAFALARMLLDRDLVRPRKARRAVVVDVDETVLDNSRYQAQLILANQVYGSATWTAWCNRAEASAVPGAVEFLRYANARGVRVFYITNRKDAEKDGTARNLKQLGFPEVNDQTLLVRTDPKSSSKEPRRLSVASRYHIVLLMGDDLNDFTEVFEQSRTVASRLDAVEKSKREFGRRFIVLPNPMYGHWEDAIYGEGKLSEAEKEVKRRKALKN